MELTTRNRNIISGLIAIVFVSSAVILGVARAFGAFDDTYLLKAAFDSAGQGLQKGSDVKIRGVNVGRVDSVDLVGEQAVVSMSIKTAEKIPKTATLTVRPKTLFGEKFVDVETDPGFTGSEASTNPADFYPTSGTVRFAGKTTGGFELERVLTDAYPLLREIKPEDIMTVLHNLAVGADGLGPAVNRQIANSAKLANVFAQHDADQREFLADLDRLAQELASRSDDVVALAKSLNVALPPLNSREDALALLLQQTARLSNDVADLLENNTAFVDKSFTEGQQTLDILSDRRAQLIPLVQGIASYAQWVSEVIRIDVGDGTQMAAVKGLLGKEGCLLGICSGGNTLPATPTSTGSSTGAAADGSSAGPPDDVVSALLNYLLKLGRRQ